MVWIALLLAGVAIAGAVGSFVRASRQEAAAREAVARLHAENLALHERVTGLSRLANENRSGVQDAKDRAGAVRRAVEVERERLIETRKLLEDVRSAQNHRVSREHGNTALVLREARRTSRVSTTKRVLLLVTIHRSGSTTLFDILRGHPEVFFEPTATFWEAAGLEGRRYPMDLSNGPTAELAIEVEPGVGALIPAASGQTDDATIALEKAHPQFFGFDANSFADHLAQVEGEADFDIEIMYGIRAPLDAMWSMIEYQERNPLWYQFLKPDAVPAFIERSLVELEVLRTRIPGRVLDFSDITESSAALRDAFNGLGEHPVPDDALAKAREAFTTANRSKLQRGRFVGEGRGERDPLGPGGAWAELDATIGNAQAVYERLRAQHHG